MDGPVDGEPPALPADEGQTSPPGEVAAPPLRLVGSGRLVGAARLLHPFPSLLDGAVVALVALVAGGERGTVLLLGLSMTLLQFAIGAANDVVDAGGDAGRKPGKPIPGGHVTSGQAKAVVVMSAIAGLALSTIGGPGLVALALAGLAVGLAYDRWAKGTTFSWLPLALGIPLLPVYGWFGATGQLPGLFLVLVPAAANAGTALAIANSAVDLERDEAAGQRSIPMALGLERASLLVLGLHFVVAILASATTWLVEAPAGWLAAVLLACTVPLGGALLGITGAGRRSPALREISWEVQAVGTGLLAVAWLGALSAAAQILPG